MVTFTKLRLTGFKSFVEPTELHIEPGLTGIVGPNGCGKSNLVEALRWVMGETSAKRVRGREMSDLIFAGSASRPARNLADVVLALDNRDRTAPAHLSEAAEIEVTRRVERDGGSTYRINGREVRARDVQMLFADQASGAHSTALVSQGRVAAIINAKPEQRRLVLEEAAGITGLHARRHEAELRLRAAESNLERVEDVLGALDTQLAGLKRQARQASRYRKLGETIRRLEAIRLHHTHRAATDAEAAAREALGEIEAVVVERTRIAAETATRQTESAGAMPGLRDAEAAAGAALQRLIVERDGLDREEREVEAAIKQTEERRRQSEEDREKARSRLEDARAALTRLEEEATELVASRQDEAKEIAAAEAAREAAAIVVQEGEASLARVSHSLSTAEAEARALDGRERALTERLAKSRRRLESVAAEHDRLAADQLPPAALAALEAELTALDRSLQAARAIETERAAEAETAQGAVETARAERQTAAEAVTGLKAEIAALASVAEQPAGELWPPLVDEVTVEKGYEPALAAALGDDLEASLDTGAPAFWQDLPPYDRTDPLPAGLEPLAARVKAPGALARRLERVALVADADIAGRLHGSLRPGQLMVTLEGALWRWDGFVRQADAPGAAAQRLAQRNRLAEQRTALPPLEATLAEKREETEAAETAARTARKSVEEARAEVGRLYREADGLRRRHGELARQAAAADSRLQGLKEQSEQLEIEVREAEAELLDTRTQRAAVPALEPLREEAGTARSALAEARSTLTTAETHLGRLRREREIKAERLQAIAREQGAWRSRLGEAEAALADLQSRRSTVEAELARLSARPSAIAVKRERLAESIAAAEAARREAGDALALGETAEREAQKALKAAESELAESREERVRREARHEQAVETVRAAVEAIRQALEVGPGHTLEAAGIGPDESLPEPEKVEAELARQTKAREALGAVNLRAEQEAQEIERQIEETSRERDDLVAAIAKLRQAIGRLNREGRERLVEAFEQVDQNFRGLFTRLFGGGSAELKLIGDDDPLNAGLEILARPPGKRLQSLSLLSGGEQALTALALLFGVFLVNPAPICVLDEVDAPLDDANVDRFCTLVSELAHRGATRFLIITHHRMTMARVDRLYGVTMAERGVSQLVSVDLAAAEELRESA